MISDVKIRAYIVEQFGIDSVKGPIRFLKDAGYELQRNWRWKPKTGIHHVQQMPIKERACLTYLMLDWGYGGLHLE